MSLDIYFSESKLSTHQCECTCCNNIHEISNYKSIAHFNITHNLTQMASEAGIYEYLWRAPENDILFANQLIEPLKKCLKKLKQDPEKFKKYNPDNGWGNYDLFIKNLEEILKTCENFPNTLIETDR